MAKEMMIVFVYDTLRCLAEADDPADAVLYFHPGWVSDSQRMSLCGQLMGVCHCVKAIFSAPRVLALHSGKFVIKEYGRYTLAVGSDRNIPDWMLKNRAEKLTSLIKVYHCDLQTLASQFPGENNPRFSEKLYQMFETYLPILQYGCYMFQTVPLLNLPKSATNIFLESMQVLEHCQRLDGVLGGTILYNNKIVATQLSSKLASHLSMVDPYRIKSPAESLMTEYELPLGAQLLVVYINKKYYDTLKKDAERVSWWYENGFEKVKSNKNAPSKHVKEPVVGSMKRDKSLLFTAVPEEEIQTGSPSPTSPQGTGKTTLKESLSNSSNMPDVVPFTSKPRVRPNKLTLSFKNSVSRDSIDEDRVVPAPAGPTFTGQTSVCSTPMLEFKRLHGNVMSICRNSDDQLLAEALNVPVHEPTDVTKESESVYPSDHTNIRSDIATVEKARKISKELNVTAENMVPKPSVNMRKIKSLSDINSGFKRISYLAAMRFGKAGTTNKNLSLNSDDSPLDNIETLDRISVTITDPYYPVFRNDGIPISKALFNEYLTQNYAEMTRETENASKIIQSNKDFEPFQGFDSDTKASPIRRKSYDITKTIVNSDLPTKPDKLRRKSLCLPLKSLGSERVGSKDSELSGSLFENRKKLSGVQLTPLMEKLSHLAFSEKSSGYSSRGVTPMEFKDFTLSTPSIEKTIVFPEESKEKDNPEMLDSGSESDDDSHNSSFSIDCVKSVLYVCGLQNISLILLMDEKAAKDCKIVNSLWEASMQSLGTIEQMCMEPMPGCDESSEAYSYLSLDPQWGPVKKGGPWASGDIATMGYIHKDFQDDPSLTEIIIRNEESLVFGTSCGGAEVYYQESACKQAGLPTPADLMGTAPLKAKRRLQRDHTITIF